MAGPHDDTYESLPALLAGLFEALETALQTGLDQSSGELTGPLVVLDVVYQHLGPALEHEVQAAGTSGPALWYLAHLASAVVQSVRMPTSGATAALYRPIRDANKQVKSALTATGKKHEDETLQEFAQQLSDDLVKTLPAALAPALADGLTQSLPSTLAASLTQTLPAAVAPTLSTDLMQSLPGPLAQAIVTAIQASGTGPGGAVGIASLSQLAAAPVNLYITSSGDAVAFLQTALALLTAAQNSAQGIPPGLVQPITNVVLSVFNYAALNTTVSDLNKMIALKQQITAILLQPVMSGGN
jgi:hypothetical protein